MIPLMLPVGPSSRGDCAAGAAACVGRELEEMRVYVPCAPLLFPSTITALLVSDTQKEVLQR